MNTHQTSTSSSIDPSPSTNSPSSEPGSINATSHSANDNGIFDNTRLLSLISADPTLLQEIQIFHERQKALKVANDEFMNATQHYGAITREVYRHKQLFEQGKARLATCQDQLDHIYKRIHKLNLEEFDKKKVVANLFIENILLRQFEPQVTDNENNDNNDEYSHHHFLDIESPVDQQILHDDEDDYNDENNIELSSSDTLDSSFHTPDHDSSFNRYRHTSRGIN